MMTEYPQLIIFLIAFIGMLAILFGAIRWCVDDAYRRGRSPVYVTIAVVLFFPWGLIAWLLFRPDVVRTKQREFNIQDYREQ